jgi:Asp-tRNA(Asn)/Glu-tRNA(Gln) amidotransferase B subunit
VNEYRNGKSTIIMFLVGQVIRELHGKGNAQQIRSLLEQKLAA